MTLNSFRSNFPGGRFWAASALATVVAILGYRSRSIAQTRQADSRFGYEAGVCVAEDSPFRHPGPGPSPRVWRTPRVDDRANADLALVVVGPNHTSRPHPENNDHTNTDDMHHIAQEIVRAVPDLHRLVVVVSESGGCDGCGWAAGAYAAGTAQVIHSELSRLSGQSFGLLRVLPNTGLENVNMSAFIIGSSWRPSAPAMHFAGPQFGDYFPNQLTPSLYAYARLTSDQTSIAIYGVHTSANSITDRRHQMEFLLDRASHESNVSATFIGGDFNVTSDQFQEFLRGGNNISTDDVAWLSPLRARADWMSLGVPCQYSNGSTFREASLFGDKLGVAELLAPPSSRRQTLIPVAYAFTPAANGDPVQTTEPLRFEGVAHGGLGIFYRLVSVEAPVSCPTNMRVCPGGCVALGTNENCGNCGDVCTGGRVCQGGGCACPGSQIACGAVCVDANSNEHCGSCAGCPDGTSCHGRVCTCDGEGVRLCGGRCTDTSRDRANCGDCDSPCPADRQCVNSQCACGRGYALCPSDPPRCVPRSMYSRACPDG